MNSLLELALSAATYDAATEVRARIDEEIMMHALSIYNLRSRRNALSPICRLPREILATIFIHCARNYHRNPHTLTRKAPRWVKVSYVCRHWRAVALDCPTLWAYHFVISLRWTEELLARSKQALLKISIKIIPPRRSRNSAWLSPIKKLMDHAERIQEFYLDIPSDPSYEIYSLLSSRTPCLRNLKILIHGWHSGWRSVLFQGDTQSLRTLQLSHCSGPWYSFKLNALTVLDLRHVAKMFQQSMEAFLATLSCMQDLTHLRLEDVLASATTFLSSTAFHAYQKINLPHLSCLWMEAPLSTVVAFLSCVNIPFSTKVILEASFENSSSSDDHALLCSAIAENHMSEDRRLSSSAIRSMVIDFKGSWRAGVVFSSCGRDCNCSRSSLFSKYQGHHNPLEIAISKGMSRMTIDWDRIASDICCSIPLTNVQNVHVIRPPYSPAFWRKMLGHLQDLRYIKLSSGNMPDLSVLSVTDPIAREDVENRTSDRAQGHALAPRLEDLVLHQITFSSGDSDMEEPAITQRCLVDALSTRNMPQVQITITVDREEEDDDDNDDNESDDDDSDED